METFCCGRLELKHSAKAFLCWTGIWTLVLIGLLIFMGLSDVAHLWLGFYIVANFFNFGQALFTLCGVCIPLCEGG